jgi:hypothetical protein
MLLKNRRVRQCTTARSLLHIKIKSIVSLQSHFPENGVRTRLHKSQRAVIHFRSFTGGRIDFGALQRAESRFIQVVQGVLDTWGSFFSASSG